MEKGPTLQTELDLDRKVVMNIRKFTDLDQKSSLLLSTSVFAHNLMEGSLRTITIDNLTKQASST